MSSLRLQKFENVPCCVTQRLVEVISTSGPSVPVIRGITETAPLKLRAAPYSGSVLSSTALFISLLYVR